MRVNRARASLSVKGFVEEKRDHCCFFFLHEGRKTRIRTKLSLGRQISEYQLKRMRGQLRFPDVEQLVRLLSCDMDGDEYRDHLRRQGVL
jgi:hypothetical protein